MSEPSKDYSADIDKLLADRHSGLSESGSQDSPEKSTYTVSVDFSVNAIDQQDANEQVWAWIASHPKHHVQAIR